MTISVVNLIFSSFQNSNSPRIGFGWNFFGMVIGSPSSKWLLMLARFEFLRYFQYFTLCLVRMLFQFGMIPSIVCSVLAPILVMFFNIEVWVLCSVASSSIIELLVVEIDSIIVSVFIPTFCIMIFTSCKSIS